jgi:hypothetical protein
MVSRRQDKEQKQRQTLSLGAPKSSTGLGRINEAAFVDSLSRAWFFSVSWSCLRSFVVA